MLQNIGTVIFGLIVAWGAITLINQAGVFSDTTPRNRITHVRDTVLACQSRDMFESISKMYSRGSQDMARDMARTAISGGKCLILRPGQKLRIKDVVLLGPTRVSVADSAKSYWTNGEMLE